MAVGMVARVPGNETESYVRNFLNSLLKDVMSTVGVECGSLFLCDDRSQELVLDSFYNSQQLQIQGLKRRIGEGVCGKVARDKSPVLVKDVDTDIRFGRNGFSHYHTKSFISLPIICQDRLVGVINLADKKNGSAFNEEDLAAASMMVKYAAMALANYRQFAQLHAEKEDLHKQKVLLERYAFLGKLASGIVHEVNNPLDGIIRYINILLSQMDDNHVAREYLLEVKKGLERIAHLTKSVLAFSRQVNAEPRPESRSIDLVHAVDEALEVLRGKRTDGLKVVKHFRRPSLVVEDLGLQNVFINIVKNALDAMPRGGVLEVVADVDEESVFLCFTDTGKGIPSDIKSHIFEPFFTTKGISEGNGLGLAICKEIIDRYGGTIHVHSVPSHGATFTIAIPKRYLRE
jgi:signal transduction histidine kinase